MSKRKHSDTLPDIVDEVPKHAPSPKLASGDDASLCGSDSVCRSSAAEAAGYSSLVDGVQDTEPTLAMEDFDASQDLFEKALEVKEDETAPSIPETKKSLSLGTDVCDFRRMPGCAFDLGPLLPSTARTILFKTSRSVNLVDGSAVPLPHPTRYADCWDDDHVRMPCSSHSLYPVPNPKPGEDPLLKRRWELVENALSSGIRSSLDLQEAILKYNSRYAKRWSFAGLHSYFSEVVDIVEAQEIFDKTLPFIITLALRMPQICTQAIPLLKREMNHTILMTQEQAACILANAFLCTFPRRNAVAQSAARKQVEYANYPDINFNRIFSSRHNHEKLTCIFHYFRRISENMPTGVISFSRQCLENFPDWASSECKLSRLHVSKKGTIEDFGHGMLQVDFANKFIGGGVLGHGCVQEEIRFMICPELIVGCLFTEVLGERECLIMKGCERFSYYSGYAETFRWLASYCDEAQRDRWGRLEVELVGIDAICYRSKSTQFAKRYVDRELNKAFCGFFRPGLSTDRLSAVATGNWGCGVFGGDKQLKSLIQLMAASVAGRDVAYFTFDDEELMTSLHAIHKLLVEREITMGKLYQLLEQYYSEEIEPATAKRRSHPLTLYDFIYIKLGAVDLCSDQYHNNDLNNDKTNNASDDDNIDDFNMDDLIDSDDDSVGDIEVGNAKDAASTSTDVGSTNIDGKQASSPPDCEIIVESEISNIRHSPRNKKTTPRSADLNQGVDHQLLSDDQRERQIDDQHSRNRNSKKVTSLDQWLWKSNTKKKL